MEDPRIARIIDVNLNRLTEGLRVVEDVVRLGLERKRLPASVRKLRRLSLSLMSELSWQPVLSNGTRRGRVGGGLESIGQE
jgi:hypothetical protein